MARSSMLYRELSSSCLSLGGFPWREVVVQGLPGFSSIEAAGKTEARELSGGFHYKSSALVASPCRNRFILWHYEGDVLSLLEVSLDTNLSHNALKLVLRGVGPVLPDVCVQEVGSAHVVVLFATASTVFRLILPHPEAIIKDPKLAVVGEGAQPSVLAFASSESFTGSNMATVFSQPTSMVAVTDCSSWMSVSGVTTFALPSPTGTIFLVQLTPPTSHGLPVRTELKETSVIHRLWSSLMPVTMRGSGEVEDAPVSVVMHMFAGETVVIALCRDLTLKLWSCQQSQCLMTHTLTDYLECEEDVVTQKADKLVLRKAPNGNTTSLRFGVYVAISGVSQISMFQLLLVDNQLMLSNLHNYNCSSGGTLVDFQSSNREVWGVWRRREGGGQEEKTLVQRAVYDSDFPEWQKIALSSPPPREAFVPPHLEPREAYLQALLHPGRFSTLALCKALELYGGALDPSATPQELRREVIGQVERELLASAGSYDLRLDEYRDLVLKCWSKFYGCCHEYQRLLSRPLSLFHDPSTGMTALLQRGAASFLHPASPVDCLSGEGQHLGVQDPVLAAEVATFMDCVKLTADQLPSEVLESFLVDLAHQQSKPVVLAMELASVLQDESVELVGSEVTLVKKVKQGLGCIRELTAVLEVLVRALDPCKQSDITEDMDSEEDSAETELQLALSQLFASHVATTIIGASLQEVCYGRLQLCRDVMVFLCLVCTLGVSEASDSIDADYLPTFSSLLQHYHTLHWFTSQPALTTNISAFEANMKQLAALEISSGKGPQSSTVSGTSATLVELYLSTQGGQELRTSLVKEHVLPPDTPLHPYWARVLPRMIDMVLRQLWPSTSLCSVCEFMLANCQYTHLQDYVAMVNMFVLTEVNSREFLLGQSHLGKGEVYKAKECFETASSGVDDPSEPLLQRVAGVGNEGVEGESEGGGGGRLAQYYIKVLRLFEQVPAPSLVIAVADEATKRVSQDDPNCPILWSTLFKYHLELGHSEEAYAAMMGNPDPARRSDCLRHLVIVLMERQHLNRLCSFDYAGMEEEIEKVLEDRARTVDITKHGYYDLLYCYHTTRGNIRKSAYVMYEQGLRLGREAPGLKSLQKQANCYSMALTALNLTDPKYAWVIRPVEVEEAALPGRRKASRRKRTHPSLQGSTKRRIEVLTISDIEKEYLLVRAKLRLLLRDQTMTTQLSSPFVSAEEVVALLVQVGLFDTAIDISLRFSTPMSPIFEALTARCVHLSVNVVAFRHGGADTSNWDWLGLNEGTTVTKARENSIADKAWSLLHSHLEQHDPSQGHRLQECVAKKLLSMGAQLPQWMVNTYKLTNPAELLRLYLTFDLVEAATLLALEYIDAVMGHGKEYFGMETALHASAPSVWLPHSTFDHLQLALQAAPTDSTLAELSQQLNSKLDQYFHLVDNISGDMEHEAQCRHRQLQLHSL